MVDSGEQERPKSSCVRPETGELQALLVDSSQIVSYSSRANTRQGGLHRVHKEMVVDDEVRKKEGSD